MKKIRLAVFVSGSGTLLEAMIKAGLAIDLVVADRNCRGFDEVAMSRRRIKTVLVDRNNFKSAERRLDRVEFTNEIIRVLDDNAIDLVAMAGFMTILSPHIFVKYGGKITNSHPSLLPLFKGDHAVRDALNAGAKVTGFTIHLATAELDSGEMLAQGEVAVLPEDNVDTLHERIKECERVAYPLLLRNLMRKMQVEQEALSLVP